MTRSGVPDRIFGPFPKSFLPHLPASALDGGDRVRISHYRKYTANRTFYLDHSSRELFVKINPNPHEASAELAGHQLLERWYPVPALVWHRSWPRLAVTIYERHGGGATDQGLLLDHINAADQRGQASSLSDFFDQVLLSYRTVIGQTIRLAPSKDTNGKLYGQRLAPGGRVDCYYQSDRPLLLIAGSDPLRLSDLAQTTLIVNGKEHRIDLDSTVGRMRHDLDSRRLVWSAVTQGDPTDFNIGSGPVWFDYDTAGLNALAGEFACFLWYQLLQGGWLTPRYNSRAFADHPRSLSLLSVGRPVVHFARDGRHGLVIDYEHRPSPARRYLLDRYLDELVDPVVGEIGVEDQLAWLRPYLVLRIIGVYNLCDLAPADAALSLAYLARVLSPQTELRSLLGAPRRAPTIGEAS